jgi:hypothetical protein
MKHSVAVDAASVGGAFAQRKMSKGGAFAQRAGRKSETPITRTSAPVFGCGLVYKRHGRQMGVEVRFEKPSVDDSIVELPSESSGQKSQNKPTRQKDMV